MTKDTVAHRSESTSVTRRYWRRTTDARPFWPGGLLPTLGLLALFVFGAMVTAPRIEAEVRDEVAGRLDGTGVTINTVSSDGQGVRVAAEGAADNETYLRALAESTRCSTWAGPLTCPTAVDVSLDAPMVLPEPADRAHPFAVTRAQNAVTLSGEVPSVAERERIVSMAGAQFDIVNDALTVSNEAATANYPRAADRALAVLGQLQEGRASWSGEALSVTGAAQAAAVDAALSQFQAMGSGSVLGEFDVRALVDEDSCNNEFAEILSGASIRFRTSSAEIDAGNNELLERLVAQARRCDGNLRIAGHTDSRGDAAMNQALSFARAASVRDALVSMGISADRLAAEGLGESAPIADNATAAGRAVNRRIVIAVDSTN